MKFRLFATDAPSYKNLEKRPNEAGIEAYQWLAQLCDDEHPVGTMGRNYPVNKFSNKPNHRPAVMRWLRERRIASHVYSDVVGFVNEDDMVLFALAFS